MKMRNFLSILALICGFSYTSCGNASSEEEDEIKAAADSFATKYYNWRFKDAMQYSTEECQEYIRYISSNVHESDIEALHECDELPNIKTGNVTINSDKEASIDVELKNVYLMDTLGTRVHLNPEVTKTLTLQKSNGIWKVAAIK